MCGHAFNAMLTAGLVLRSGVVGHVNCKYIIFTVILTTPKLISNNDNDMFFNHYFILSITTMFHYVYFYIRTYIHPCIIISIPPKHLICPHPFLGVTVFQDSWIFLGFSSFRQGVLGSGIYFGIIF